MSENDTARVAEDHTARDVVPAHRVAGGATVLSLHGEIDVLTASALAQRLDAFTASAGPDLVLDLRPVTLRPVTFIDCAGLGVLCRARNRTLSRRGRLRLVAESAGFRRILRATGLGDVFELHTRPPQPPPASREGAVP
ncbi:STAS domain-containing protein [Streptomyces sp. NPDC046759]|uniref:STAS domain-containing protein n=1 Tax=Streptomyces sp. NPDC046759 TaxID=3155019 RepID=UPI0033D65B6F